MLMSVAKRASHSTYEVIHKISECFKKNRSVKSLLQFWIYCTSKRL